LIGSSAFTCSDKVISDFKRNKKCFLSGLNEPEKLEIDHRMPVTVCNRERIMLPVMTKESVESGEADKEFMVISKSINSLKREICLKCTNGEGIRMPGVIDHRKYVASINLELKIPCLGCFWYNHKIDKCSDEFINREVKDILN